LPRRETNERLTLLSAPSTSRPHLLQLRHGVLASQSQCRCWVMSRLFGKGCSMSAATKTGHSDAIDASTTA
jgi:hypothetical protein